MKWGMATTQLYLFYLFNFLYLVLSVVVAILTRATPKRIAGAVAGGAASGVVAFCLIALWERPGVVARDDHLGVLLPGAVADLHGPVRTRPSSEACGQDGATDQ